MRSSSATRLRGPGVIAGEHGDCHAEPMQRLDRSGRGRLDRIGDGQETGDGVVHRDKENGPALRRNIGGARGEIFGRCADRRWPTVTMMAIDLATDAEAGDRGEVLRGGQAQTTLFRAGENRGSEGMFAGRFDGGGEAQQLVFARGPARRRFRSARFAFGQRTGLVDGERVDFPERSSASASRTRMPSCAPRPMPTMIDIGVARPSAQGQAMISTATALSSA